MISITKDEQNFLIKLSRNTLSKFFRENIEVDLSCDKNNYPNLWSSYGAFVSIYVNKKLRGCIGHLISKDPLYDLIKQMSISSATLDHRFSPLTIDDLRNLSIEISIIGPLKKISNIDEIIIGTHGIYIKSPAGNGTLLPQVAEDNNWDVEQFLEYCSRDKAGLSWDAWKTSEIYIYESMIISD